MNKNEQLERQISEENSQKRVELHVLYRELRKFEREITFFMIDIMQGNIPFSYINADLRGKLDSESLRKLYVSAFEGPRCIRKRALTIIYHLYGVSSARIEAFLFLSRNTVKRYIHRFKQEGVHSILDRYRKKPKKSLSAAYKEEILSIMHAPPSEYGINRTTWTIKLIKNVLMTKGHLVGKNTITDIILSSGYKFRRAKEVLTSHDPKYKEKLIKINRILLSLGSNDRFFSIDEFGPVAIKKRGGIRRVQKNEYPTVPQFQRSKGVIIVTAALELSTNQITHFYSKKKDSKEIVKLLRILINKYSGCRRIYLSWDGASWHSSKAFQDEVQSVNKYAYRKKHNTPIVKIAPLPIGAQFLNVIESVFSGMARAVINNSDYQSIGEAKTAIDRYFNERNGYFRRNPKRAGKKIWGDELIPPKFKEGQNCKDPRWR